MLSARQWTTDAVRCPCIRWETTTATEHQRPSPSTHGWLRWSERTFSSCSIQRAGFHTADRGKKRPAVAKTKGEKRAAASHCFMETNDFANSDAEKKHYCGIVFEWVQVGRPHQGIQSAELLHKNTEGGRKNVYVCGVRIILKNRTAAETIRAQVKAMHSLWQHRNRTLTRELAVFTFSQLSIGTKTSNKQAAQKWDKTLKFKDIMRLFITLNIAVPSDSFNLSWLDHSVRSPGLISWIFHDLLVFVREVGTKVSWNVSKITQTAMSLPSWHCKKKKNEKVENYFEQGRIIKAFRQVV